MGPSFCALISAFVRNIRLPRDNVSIKQLDSECRASLWGQKWFAEVHRHCSKMRFEESCMQNPAPTNRNCKGCALASLSLFAANVALASVLVVRGPSNFGSESGIHLTKQGRTPAYPLTHCREGRPWRRSHRHQIRTHTKPMANSDRYAGLLVPSSRKAARSAKCLQRHTSGYLRCYRYC